MRQAGWIGVAAGDWIERKYLDVLETVLRRDFRRARPAFETLAAAARTRLADRRRTGVPGGAARDDRIDRRSPATGSLAVVLGRARASLARLDGAPDHRRSEDGLLDALEALVRVRKVLVGCPERPALTRARRAAGARTGQGHAARAVSTARRRVRPPRVIRARRHASRGPGHARTVGGCCRPRRRVVRPRRAGRTRA